MVEGSPGLCQETPGPEVGQRPSINVDTAQITCAIKQENTDAAVQSPPADKKS